MRAPLVSTRGDPELARRLDALAERRGEPRSSLVPELIERGLQAAQTEEAIRAYRLGRASFGRAVELAGVSVWEFHKALLAEGGSVPRTYSGEDLEEDIAQATGER